MIFFILKFVNKILKEIKSLNSHALNIQMLESTENLFERVDQQVTPLYNLVGLNFQFSLKSMFYFILKFWNNFISLNTQISDEGDTSETTREAMSGQEFRFDFTDYASSQKPPQNDIDEDFLSWLIGFIEGDGSFWTRSTNSLIGTSFKMDFQRKRADFEITQHIDEIEVLNFSQKKLGFGNVGNF